MNTLLHRLIAISVASIVLSACAQDNQTSAAAVEANVETALVDSAGTAETKDTLFNAPSGTYQVDLTHASLSFGVQHVGLSNYIGRFTAYSAALNLDSADLSGSSLQIDIESASIDVDYTGDYKAGHADSGFDTWQEQLAKSDKFFNANAHPTISYRSTFVEQTGAGTAQISGELTMLGQTNPVTLEATVVGSTANHPFQPGRGAIGFSASGSLNRSDYGMNFLLKPPLVGDLVTISFEGEFLQDMPETAAP